MNPQLVDRYLSPAEAKRFYDRLGSWQDRQAFYENAAINDLIEHAAFDSAHSVFEFGCGTGALAARLLQRHLPADARYLGLDVSSTMASLAQGRLKPWSSSPPESFPAIEQLVVSRRTVPKPPIC